MIVGEHNHHFNMALIYSAFLVAMFILWLRGRK